MAPPFNTGMTLANRRKLRDLLNRSVWNNPGQKDACGGKGLMVHQRELETVVTPKNMHAWGVGCVLVCWAPGTGKTLAMAVVAENYMSEKTAYRILVNFPFGPCERPESHTAVQEEEFWERLYHLRRTAYKKLQNIAYTIGLESYGFTDVASGLLRKIKSAFGPKKATTTTAKAVKPGKTKKNPKKKRYIRKLPSVDFDVIWDLRKRVGNKKWNEEIAKRNLPKVCDQSTLGAKSNEELEQPKNKNRTPYVLLVDEAHGLISRNTNQEKAMETKNRFRQRIAGADKANLIVLFTGTPVQEDDDDVNRPTTPQLLLIARGIRKQRNILVSWNMDTKSSIYPKSSPPVDNLLENSGILHCEGDDELMMTNAQYLSQMRTPERYDVPGNKIWYSSPDSPPPATLKPSARFKCIADYVQEEFKKFRQLDKPLLGTRNRTRPPPLKCCFIIDKRHNPETLKMVLEQRIYQMNSRNWPQAWDEFWRAGIGYYDGLGSTAALDRFRNVRAPAILILTSQAGEQGLSVKNATHMVLGDISYKFERPRWTQIQQRAARALRMCGHGDVTSTSNVKLRLVVVGGSNSRESRERGKFKSPDGWKLQSLKAAKRIVESESRHFTDLAFNNKEIKQKEEEEEDEEEEEEEGEEEEEEEEEEEDED